MAASSSSPSEEDYSTGTTRPPPLTGIKVLELGQVIAAPYAGLLLADLGADVIKIEYPGVGDSSRDPAVTPMGGDSATFITFNRNKRSVALDLTHHDDYETMLELVKSADVVLTNMVPRVARKLRIDPASLASANSELITCSIQGFRSRDERHSEPTYDLMHQAIAGYMSMQGHEGDPPTRVCVPIADLVAAHFAVQGILAALVSRGADGRGDHIEVPMYDSMLSFLTYTATLYLNGGDVPRQMGSEHEYVVPWQAVNASDGAFVVGARSEKFWVRLCRAISREDLLVDPRFVDNEARRQHRDEMRVLLDDVFGTHPIAHWIALLSEVGVPVAPVRSVPEALEAARRDMPDLIHTIPGHSGRSYEIVGNPISFRDHSLATPTEAPALDQHRTQQSPAG